MGNWDELDTELSVSNDTSSLDDLIEICNSDSDFADLFEPAIRMAEGYKEAIDEGSKMGIHITAERLKDKESRHASNPEEHPNAQGILASSIQIEAQSEYQYLVGTSITHFYPLCVEFGRGEVHPIPPTTRLRFYGKDGYLVYPLMSKEAPARPFVEPAFDETISLIEGSGFGVFREVCKEMDKVK